MLTGTYLFESCHSDTYCALMSDVDRMAFELKSKCQNKMTETELNDLVKLLKGMLHPDVHQRLSMKALLEANLEADPQAPCRYGSRMGWIV